MEAVAWSPDGAYLLTGSALINVATGEATEPLPRGALDETFAPDGRAILYRLRDAGSPPSWSIFSVGFSRANSYPTMPKPYAPRLDWCSANLA